MIVAVAAAGAGAGHILAAAPTGSAAPRSPIVEALRKTDGDRLFLDAAQQVDAREIALGAPIKSVLNVRRRMAYGDFVWRDRGVPQGSVWVRVDLKSQLLSVFRAGHEIGTAVILYGASEKQTPTGVFPILAKIKDHESSTYDARMPYTLRLTGDGVSIHGSDVRWGAATHGCIGVPVEFARQLFDQVAKGSKVVILADPATALSLPVSASDYRA